MYTDVDNDQRWRDLNLESGRHYAAGDFGLYRNTRYSMCEMVEKEGKYKNAFYLISEVIYYDLSGLGNGYREMAAHLTDREIAASMVSMLPDQSFPFMIPPYIIGALGRISRNLRMSDAEIESELRRNFEKFSMPRHLLTKEECVQATMAELYEKQAPIESIYATAKKRAYGKI